MAYYVLTRDGTPISIEFESPYPVTDPTISAHTFDEQFPDLNTSTWNPLTDRYDPTGNSLTKLMFLTRFTIQERIAIRTSTDPIVNDVMSLFDAASYISVSDANTVQGIQYFVTVGLLTAERAQEILA